MRRVVLPQVRFTRPGATMIWGIVGFLGLMGASGAASLSLYLTLSEARANFEKDTAFELTESAGESAPTETDVTTGPATRDRIEIALVIDRTNALLDGPEGNANKEAIAAFVGQIEQSARHHEIHVSLIPYSGQVALPPSLFDGLGIRRQHGYSNCVRFGSRHFASLRLPHASLLHQVSHFDPFTVWGPLSANQRRAFFCPTGEEASMLLHASDTALVRERISGLTPASGGAVDLGVRWASWSFGETARDHSGMPPTDGQVHRVMVILAGGEIGTEYRLDTARLGRWSDIWLNPATGLLWRQSREPGDADNDGVGGERWYAPHLDSIGKEGRVWRNTVPIGMIRLNYSDLFDRVSVFYNAIYHHPEAGRSPEGYGAFYEALFETVGADDKAARLQTACAAAKREGVRVFTVGVGLNPVAARQIDGCASGPSYALLSDGEALDRVLGNVARRIAGGVLTQ